MRAVPLARRNLTAEPRRLVASALGVGLAVMLILLLDGLWAGIRAGASSYEDNAGADLYVAQTGTTNFYGASSRVSLDLVDEVRLDPAVEWAAPVRSFYAVVELQDKKVPVAVIGSDPGEPGGAWKLYAGRPPLLTTRSSWAACSLAVTASMSATRSTPSAGRSPLSAPVPTRS